MPNGGKSDITQILKNDLFPQNFLPNPSDYKGMEIYSNVTT